MDINIAQKTGQACLNKIKIWRGLIGLNKKAALGLNRSSTAGRLPIPFALVPEGAVARRSIPLVGHLPSNHLLQSPRKESTTSLRSLLSWNTHPKARIPRTHPEGLVPRDDPGGTPRMRVAIPKESFVTLPANPKIRLEASHPHGQLADRATPKSRSTN